jgi:hypothetical protein
MFDTFDELKSHLSNLLIEDEMVEEANQVLNSRDPIALAKTIHKIVEAEPADMTAWLIEAVCFDQFSQWGRMPQ